MADKFVGINNVNIVHETENAVLIDQEGERHWIPLSQVNAIHRHPQPWQSSIEISQWIANEKGFIH